jgi:zinc protease
MEEVREELGGTYGIFVGPSYAWRPEETYQLTVSFGSDPERAEELAAVVLEGIERFKKSGPTEEQASAARETLLRQFETDFQENGTWLGQLVSDLQRGEEPGAAVETFVSSVEGLTVTEIRDAARRYFDMENYVRVTLLPE